MTQMPPPPGFPAHAPVPPPAPKANGMAIASLICGILGCIPVITSLLAIILGFVGIRKSKEPQTGGKGLAIAGIILGVLGLLIWAGIGVGSYFTYQYGKKMVNATQQVSSGFFGNLAAGNVDAARNATTGNMSQAQLEQLSQQLQSLGSFQDFSVTNFNADGSTAEQWILRIEGQARFDGGTKQFSGRFVGNTNDGFKVDDMQLE